MAEAGKSDVFIWADSKNKVFGFKLESITSLSALGKDEARYAAESLGRNYSFLNGLLNSRNEKHVFEIRIISRPDAELYSRGRISVYFVCRHFESSLEHAEHHRDGIKGLLTAGFPEYDFEPIKADFIPEILSPFEIRSLVEIRRRSGIEPLDSLTKSGSRKIASSAAGSSDGLLSNPLQQSHDMIFHIYPFRPSWPNLALLAGLLLFEKSPVAISFRLRPTQLHGSEDIFFCRQIASCESAIYSASPGPALRLQAQEYERFQSERLYGLRDNAALGMIQIASPAPISPAVIDSIGSYITEPAGRSLDGGDPRLKAFLSGGYETITDESPKSRQDFTDGYIAIPPHGGVGDPPRRLLFLYDSLESAAFFRFPPSTLEPIPGLPIRSWKRAAPPDNLAVRGSRLGSAKHHTVLQEVRIDPGDRKRHVYVVGQTGTGKTTLLKTMILEDIRRGEGLCVIDPHGDLYKQILANIPSHRLDDVVLIDPTDREYPVALNLLEDPSGDHGHFLAQEFVGIIRRLMADEYGSGHQMTGPIFFQHMRMNLLLTMSDPGNPGTLCEFYNIFQYPNYYRRWLPLKSQDSLLKRWVEDLLPNYDYVRPQSDGDSMGGYVGSKFQGFVFDPLLRNIFGQKRSLIDFRKVMDEGKILLINLAKGELTEENSRFLGMIILAKLMAAALSRASLQESVRRQFILYVDEFQSLATSSFVTLLSEARKFGLSLVLANQFLTQIKDTKILQAVFGNVGTTVSFRLGPEDAEIMETKFKPALNRADLINIPNWSAYISTQIQGQVVRPFNFETSLEPCLEPSDRAEEVRRRSRARYARPRSEAEAEIASSLQIRPMIPAENTEDEIFDLAEEAEAVPDQDKRE